MPRAHSRLLDDRASESRMMEGRDIENAEDEEFNPTAFTGPLPVPDPMPGWSFIYVPYLNEFGQEDPRQVMARLDKRSGGYSYVLPEEQPRLASMKIGHGTLSGFIGIQGMVLLKIEDWKRNKILAHADQRADEQMADINNPSQADRNFNPDPRAPMRVVTNRQRATTGRVPIID